MLKNKIAILILSFLIYSCSQVSNIPQNNYLGYQPRDPVPVPMVKVYDSSFNVVKEIFWESITDNDVKRKLLPMQSAQVSISKSDISGEIGYMGAGISAERGSYLVIMDYMKYRVEDAYENGKYIGNGRVGVGLRIKAEVVTTKANLNLGSLSAIGMSAKLNNLRGDISVDIVGIDSENVTNLIPLTSEIDQTSIQSALQALASIKSKLWEDETTITPHLLAFRQNLPDKESEIRSQVLTGTYSGTSSSKILEEYLSWDKDEVDMENVQKLKDWMGNNNIPNGPGDLSMFIYTQKYESMRQKAIKELNIK